jgi:hypothetical protein
MESFQHNQVKLAVEGALEGQGQLQLKCYSRKNLRKHTPEIGPDSEGQSTKPLVPTRL